jgi:hypothetical protein
MISDYQILGIGEDADLRAIRSAFRKRAKELHPDLSTIENAIPRYDLFSEVCKAYKRLVDRKKTCPPGAAPDVDSGFTTGRELKAHSDQAYVFYKQGMKFFMAIHPSQWNLDTSRMLNTRIAGQDEEQDRIRLKVIELVKLFPKAYYYFSIVVHEYPDSDWAYDAGEKMGKIEERMRMYRKIVESFTSWNVDKKAMIREYQEKSRKMSENVKAVRRDMPEDWR